MSSFERVRRDAFTLIEVLLTTLLAAVLLAALWSLLSMYSKAFESGHTRTEQAQLARTLLEQINVDLLGVVQSPPAAPALPILEPPLTPSTTSTSSSTSSSSSPPQPTSPSPPSAGASSPQPLQPLQPLQPIQPLKPAVPQNPTPSGPTSSPSAAPPVDRSPQVTAVATTSLRAAGLFGTSSFLQIDVLQPAFVEPLEEGTEGLALEEPRPGMEIAPSRAEDLKTIVYSFEELSDSGASITAPLLCLFRRELDWEQAHPARGGAGVGSNDESLASPAEALKANGPSGGALPGGSPATESAEIDPLADESIVSVPEVTHFALRYFDGAAWSEDWDSHDRGGLPKAVEVSMRFRGQDEPAVMEVPVESGVNYERLAELRHPLYRSLVVLTGNIAQPRSNDSLGGEPPVSNSPQSAPSFGATTNAVPSQP